MSIFPKFSQRRLKSIHPFKNYQVYQVWFTRCVCVFYLQYISGFILSVTTLCLFHFWHSNICLSTEEKISKDVKEKTKAVPAKKGTSVILVVTALFASYNKHPTTLSHINANLNIITVIITSSPREQTESYNSFFLKYYTVMLSQQLSQRKKSSQQRKVWSSTSGSYLSWMCRWRDDITWKEQWGVCFHFTIDVTILVLHVHIKEHSYLGSRLITCYKKYNETMK